MSTLKITLDPYRQTNSVSLDGKAVSPYSELSNYIKRPILECAERILPSAEREVNGPFSLTVMGEHFETLLLTALGQDFESCVAVQNEPFAASFKVEKRFTVVCSLAKKYGVPYSLQEYRIPAFFEEASGSEYDMLKNTSFEDAFLYVVNSKESFASRVRHSDTAIVLCLSGNNSVEFSNNTYFWNIDKSELLEIITSITDRFAKIPFIVATAEKTATVKTLSNEDRELLTLATSIEPILRISDIGKIKVGETTDIELSVLPQTSAPSSLRAEITDKSVATVENLRITGLSAGETEVLFYKSDEIIPFEKKKLVVYHDNSIKKLYWTVPSRRWVLEKAKRFLFLLNLKRQTIQAFLYGL